MANFQLIIAFMMCCSLVMSTIYLHDPPLGKYLCPDCGRHFDDTRGYRSHLDHDHAEEKDFLQKDLYYHGKEETLGRAEFFFNPPTAEQQQMFMAAYCGNTVQYVEGSWDSEYDRADWGTYFHGTEYRASKNHIKQIASDGNCMFGAISFALTGSTECHTQIRRHIYKFWDMFENLHLNGNAFPPWIDEQLGGTVARINAHKKNLIKHLRDDSESPEFGEAVDLIAAAKIFNVNILVWNKDQDHWIAYSPGLTTTTQHGMGQELALATLPLHFSAKHYNVITQIARSGK